MAKSKKKKPDASRDRPNPNANLNQRQHAFVCEYVATGNGTRAAKKAGYAGNDASLASMASALLRNPKVCAAIEKMRSETKANAIASREERLEFLTRVVRGQETEMRITSDGHGLGTSLEEAPPTIRDRIRAADLVAKMQGDLVTKVEVDTSAGVLEFVRMASEKATET